TMTYGALAKAVGRPNAARAVGGAMAKNRWPLLIPCHRVLGASGKLTGYSGVGGIETKRRLLEHERGQSQLQLI
ncbi:MAG: MGMT family protein, partial [Planctomycetota bacterium]